ncbi:MAG: hypothetical protein GX433_11780 [Deltaproteobacteria bacterium]|nr:hypothetical protein [Deltaproteobacteria bacterium]
MRPAVAQGDEGAKRVDSPPVPLGAQQGLEGRLQACQGYGKNGFLVVGVGCGIDGGKLLAGFFPANRGRLRAIRMPGMVVRLACLAAWTLFTQRVF